jgi:hypothetical protein
MEYERLSHFLFMKLRLLPGNVTDIRAILATTEEFTVALVSLPQTASAPRTSSFLLLGRVRSN